MDPVNVPGGEQPARKLSGDVLSKTFKSTSSSIAPVKGEPVLSVPVNISKQTGGGVSEGVNHAATAASALLATAVVTVQDFDFKPVYLRALLDSGSQSSLITASGAKKLRLKPKACDRTISGLAASGTHMVRGCVDLSIVRPAGGDNINCTCLVLNRLTGLLPSKKVNIPKSCTD